MYMFLDRSQISPALFGSRFLPSVPCLLKHRPIFKNVTLTPNSRDFGVLMSIDFMFLPPNVTVRIYFGQIIFFHADLIIQHISLYLHKYLWYRQNSYIAEICIQLSMQSNFFLLEIRIWVQEKPIFIGQP